MDAGAQDRGTHEAILLGFEGLRPLPAEPDGAGGAVVRFAAPFDGVRLLMARSGRCRLARLRVAAAPAAAPGALALAARWEPLLDYWPAVPVDPGAPAAALTAALVDDLVRVQARAEHLEARGGPGALRAHLAAATLCASLEGDPIGLRLALSAKPGAAPRRIGSEASAHPPPGAAARSRPRRRAFAEAVARLAAHDHAPWGWAQRAGADGRILRAPLELAAEPPAHVSHTMAMGAHRRLADWIPGALARLEGGQPGRALRALAAAVRADVLPVFGGAA